MYLLEWGFHYLIKVDERKGEPARYQMQTPKRDRRKRGRNIKWREGVSDPFIYDKDICGHHYQCQTSFLYTGTLWTWVKLHSKERWFAPFQAN